MKVIKPRSDLSTKAVELRHYCLAFQSARCDSSVVSQIDRAQKKLDVQMKTHICNGQNPTAVLELLARFNTP